MRLPMLAIVTGMLVLAAGAAAQTPLGTAFTYQGELKSNNAPANGSHDLRFTLYDAAAGGNVVAGPVCVDSVNVSGGLFTTTIDFGAVNASFNGNSRWLAIEVRADGTIGNCAAGPYTLLTQRQPLNATPYALETRGIFVSANGHVGIGSSNPINMLSVNGGGLSVVDDLDEDVTFSTNRFMLSNRSNADPAYVHTYSPEQHDFFIGGSSCMTIAPTGNVGIGTSAPASRLHVVSSTTAITGLGGQRGVQGNATGTSGSNYGVFGVSPSDAGAGVYGAATHASGANFGLFGTSSSTAGTGVYGTATANTGLTSGVHGVSASNAGKAVFGEATSLSGSAHGGYFTSTGNAGSGVFGLSSATSGSCYGGEFYSASIEGAGVFAQSTATFGNAAGVAGWAASPDGFGLAGTATANTGQAIGVAGVTSSPAGAGVRGEAFAANGTTYGVFGHSFSPSGIGSYGLASASSGATYGGYFESDSTTGRGVYGLATAASGVNIGVNGESSSTSGIGVRGYASASSGTIYGVYGRASTAASGYGVFAQGDMGASGVKPFRIDHPDDPENKYLLHYAAESPEVINFYRGTVRLDAAGGAVIELPHYFARINKTPSYQLTPMGAPMPMLHVAEEISEEALRIGELAGPGEAVPVCSFRIAGGVPNGRVSWRVEALRNDLRMRLYGAPVEREKTDDERGRYQHPEYYGLPPERAAGYVPPPAR